MALFCDIYGIRSTTAGQVTKHKIISLHIGHRFSLLIRAYMFIGFRAARVHIWGEPLGCLKPTMQSSRLFVFFLVCIHVTTV